MKARMRSCKYECLRPTALIFRRVWVCCAALFCCVVETNSNEVSSLTARDSSTNSLTIHSYNSVQRLIIRKIHTARCAPKWSHCDFFKYEFCYLPKFIPPASSQSFFRLISVCTCRIIISCRLTTLSAPPHSLIPKPRVWKNDSFAHVVSQRTATIRLGLDLL